MTTIKFISGIVLTILLGACLRLDSNMFNSAQLEDGYQLDDYTEPDFILDASYDIPDSLIHLFTYPSTEDGETVDIHALYIGNIDSIASDTVIMYCHGNALHMDFYWQRAKLLAHTGGKNRFGVMMMDYRGYGMTQGTSTEAALYTDVNGALEWLQSKGLTSDRLVIYGFSLGSAPATELTAYPRSLTPSKLILEAPFASTQVMVNDASKLAIPNSFFTNIKVENAEKIKDVSQDFLWIHGDADSFLAYETHGQVVYDNHQGTNKTAIKVAGGEHDDVPIVYGFENYTDTMLSFITQ